MARLYVIPFLLDVSFHECPETHVARVDEYFTLLTDTVTFQRKHGSDHLLLAFDWSFSAWNADKLRLRFPVRWQEKLQNVTMTRYEVYGISKWVNSSQTNPKFRSFRPMPLLQVEWEITKHAVVVPYLSMVPLSQPTSFREWSKRKNLCFYRTRLATSAHGATVLRHLPLNHPEVFEECKIGSDVTRSE
jgi:hypothetical protein